MVLQEISEDGIKVLTRLLEATFTFTLLTQCPVKKWHFDKSESKSLRKQSWPNLMFFKLWKLISFEDNCSWSCQSAFFSTFFSVSSRSTRMKTEILNLVSKHETEGKKFSISSRNMRLNGRNSQSHLEAWDWKEEFLDLVSRVEIGVSLCPVP